MIATVLIVDDERHTREGLQQALEDDYDVAVAASADEAFNLVAAQEFDVIVTDLRMPGKSGLKVIDKALTLPNRPAVLMMTAYGSIDTAVEAMRRGAVDFLTKPVNIERLEILIQRALKNRTLEVEVQQLHERLDQKFSFEGIIGDSPKLLEVIDKVKLVAPSRATILVEGESGTGKELIAQAIHQVSQRARGPFIGVHCAALSESLLESEIFGHERGSFTGAIERRIGRFESADGGTRHGAGERGGVHVDRGDLRAVGDIERVLKRAHAGGAAQTVDPVQVLDRAVEVQQRQEARLPAVGVRHDRAVPAVGHERRFGRGEALGVDG